MQCLVIDITGVRSNTRTASLSLSVGLLLVEKEMLAYFGLASVRLNFHKHIKVSTYHQR